MLRSCSCSRLFIHGVVIDGCLMRRIHTIPSVPIIDCFQKIRQQVKCYLQMAGTMRKQELQEVRMSEILPLLLSFVLKIFFRKLSFRLKDIGSII